MYLKMIMNLGQKAGHVCGPSHFKQRSQPIASAGRRRRRAGRRAFAGAGRHVRIEAGCAITSVRPKSPPLNNSGACMIAETA